MRKNNNKWLEKLSKALSGTKKKTKQKLLGAVGKILRTKGYAGLKVSKIAAVAGFDKKADL
ncbi:hypothetical protein [Chryseobacterium sp. POE27]|uniref:hypothetical protein n=1 Tax=Chryseobacterium sp. POE27 TaxID=3138177 RepID=UPI003219D84C